MNTDYHEDPATTRSSSNESTSTRLRHVSEKEVRKALQEAGVPTVIANLNISKALANSSLLIKAITQPTAMLMATASIQAKLRELIILRVAWLNACEYEWTQHYRFAKALGLSDGEISAVKNWQLSSIFDDAALAVLELCDVLYRGLPVDNDLWRRLVKTLGARLLLQKLGQLPEPGQWWPTS